MSTAENSRIINMINLQNADLKCYMTRTCLLQNIYISCDCSLLHYNILALI